MLTDPEKYLVSGEVLKNITIGMTNLPSNFIIGKKYFHHLKYSRIALGFHPLLASEHMDQIDNFISLINESSYIGEIGLDFSNEGRNTKQQQIELLTQILSSLKGLKKIISVHSRNAENELLQMLIEHNIKNVIFHWYTGSIFLIQKILSQGYYFSVNEAMCKSYHGQSVIKHIPKDRILTETDAPYNPLSNLKVTYDYLNYLNCPSSQVEQNFKMLIATIK
jgi:TatD DNase family protein